MFLKSVNQKKLIEFIENLITPQHKGAMEALNRTVQISLP